MIRSDEMIEVLFVGAALMMAGFVKGLVGLGLPPIAMGLLVLMMRPVEAAAIMVVPALLTNLWQGIGGPALRTLLARFWPMLFLTAAGTLTFSGALTTHAETAISILGTLLVAYGAYGLRSPDFVLAPYTEQWVGPLSGAVTGIVNAFTGVSSMPSVPFLQSVGLPRDMFIQAMGLSFSVSALSLIAALGMSGGFAGGSIPMIGIGILGAFVGMAGGVRLRKNLDEALFRRIVLAALIVLGLYLLGRCCK